MRPNKFSNDLASDQPGSSRSSSSSSNYQPTYQQQQRPAAVTPTYVPPVSTGNNPTAPVTPAVSPTAPTATAPASIDFGNGYSLDREKLRKIKEALLNPNKTP